MVAGAPPQPMRSSRHLIISGRVQGVGFRHALASRARALGVHGWVRNRADGSVEAVVQAEAETVAALVAWCRRGPPAARVDAITIEPSEESQAGFEVRASV